MTCRHKEGREYKITADTIDIRCAADQCKEVLHTRTRVLSSNIYAIGRDDDGHTQVQFIDYKTKGPGDAAVYFNVPQELHDEFMASDSKGEFFAMSIKDQFDWKYIQGEHKKKKRSKTT